MLQSFIFIYFLHNLFLRSIVFHVVYFQYFIRTYCESENGYSIRMNKCNVVLSIYVLKRNRDHGAIKNFP